MNTQALAALNEREFVRQWNSLLEEIHTAPDFQGGKDFGIDLPTLVVIRPDLADRFIEYRQEAKRRLVPVREDRAVYQELASQVMSRQYGLTNARKDIVDAREDDIEKIVKNYLPSGSGIDNGTKIDLDKSRAGRLVCTFGFHHMNENGFYDGWTEHKLIVTPSFTSKIDLSITGRDRNFIKDYLYETYHYALTQPYKEQP